MFEYYHDKLKSGEAKTISLKNMGGHSPLALQVLVPPLCNSGSLIPFPGSSTVQRLAGFRVFNQFRRGHGIVSVGVASNFN